MITLNYNNNNFELILEQKISPNKYIQWEKIFNKYLNQIGKVEETNEIEQLRLQNIIVNKGLTGDDNKMQEYFTTNANSITFEIFREKIMVERIMLFYKDAKQKASTKGKEISIANTPETTLATFEIEMKKGFNYNEDNMWFNCDLVELEETYNSFREFTERRNCY